MYTNDEKQFRRLTSLVLEQSEYFKADFTVHWKSDYVNYCKWIQCVGTNTKSSAAYWKKKAIGDYTLEWRLISESLT